MKKTLLLKTLLLLCILIVGSTSAWATDYSYTFSSQQYTAAGAKTLNGVSWTMAGTGGSYFGYDATKGQQFGSGNKPYSAVSLTTSGISGTITSVAVNTSGANSIAGTVAVSVGSTAFQCNNKTTASLTSTATTYTFTNTGASGDVTISWAQTSSKAIYVKSITVTYSTGGGGSDPSISLGSTTIDAPETAVSTTSIEVTYNNLTNYDADVVFYESDGTTAATYDHSWITAEINATTKNLDYSITANTGAARTAYLKVYAIGDEGDASSSLVTITQAKKTVASPTFSRDGGSYMEGLTFTLTSEGNTIYYTTDGSTPSSTSSTSIEYTAPVPIAVGNITYKAIAYDAYGNVSGVTQRTYTGIATTSLPFSWTGTDTAGKEDLAEKTGVSVSLGTNYATSNAPYRLKFDGVGKYVIIYADEKPENVYFTAKLFNAASTGSKIKVQGSDDGITFTDIEEFTIKGAANATFEFTTTNAFAANHRVVKLIMSSKDQNVAVGTIYVSAIPVTIPAGKEWITFCSTENLDFTSDIAGLEGAYTITAHENQATALTATKMTGKVKAGTGLLLRAAAVDATNPQVITIPVATTGEEQADNMLKGVTADTEVQPTAGDYTNLGLSNGEFHPYSAAGTLAAGKAYLQVPTAQMPTGGNNARLYIVLDGEATGIANVDVNANDNFDNAPMYNLAGQRVTKSYKGVVIVNGKKFINK